MKWIKLWIKFDSEVENMINKNFNHIFDDTELMYIHRIKLESFEDELTVSETFEKIKSFINENIKHDE
jgi:hypothetical protein